MTDNEIMQALECCSEGIGSCNRCPYYKIHHCAKPMHIGALNLIKRQQTEIERLKGELETDKNDGCKWVSVAERLPETDDRVLVCCKTKRGLQTINMAYFFAGFWHGHGSMSGVTHWMPLPEPPKGEPT